MSFNTISEMFLQSTGSFSDKASCYEKIDGAWKELTYSEVKILVERFAAGLSSLGIQAGDKVAIPAVCWSTSLWPIIQAGLVPVLIDVDPCTLNLSISSLKEAMTKHKIKGIDLE